MSAVKEHSNQIIKILICLCLTFVFIFVQPKEKTQQAEAIVPIVIWGAGILAGVVAEEMLEMGIKHVTGDAKTSKKGKAGKIADEILDSLDGYDFDNTNPTRKADGSLEVNMSANDRAKIAKKIADAFGDVVIDSEGRISKSRNYVNTFNPQNNAVYVDYYITNSSFRTDTRALKGVDVLKKLYDVEFTSLDANNTLITLESVIDGSELSRVAGGGGGSGGVPVPAPSYWWAFYTGPTYNIKEMQTNQDFLGSVPTARAYDAYEKALSLTGKVVHMAGGLLVPDTVRNVYPVGDGYSGDDLPNKTDLSNKPYKIPNYFPPSSSDESVEWEVVQNHYDNDVTTNQTKIDNQYETYLENGDLIKNTYNTQTINNYYTDSNYPVKANDPDLLVKIDVDVTTPPPVVIDDDDDGGSVDGFKYCVDKSSKEVVPCKDIEAIDGGLLSYLRDSYNYAVNAVQTAVNGLETIAAGSVGLVALYSEVFDWLPDEVTVLLTSGLMLMIGLRVFRK